MRKTIFKNKLIISGILIISILFSIAGLFLTKYYKNEVISQVEREYSDKLDKFERILISLNSVNRNKLLIIERVALEYIQNNNISENTTDTVIIEAFSSIDNMMEIHNLSTLRYENNPLLYNIELLNNITFNTNAFISIWQKTNKGYIRIASNEPTITKKGIPVFLSHSEDLIQLIEKGEKSTTRVANNFDSKIIRSIPVFIKGEIKLFIQIIVNETLTSSLNKIFSKEQSNIFILNVNGEPIINSIYFSDEKATGELIPMIITKRGKNKSVISNSSIFYYSYLPELKQFIGFAIPHENIKNRYRHYIIKIWAIIIFFNISLIVLFVFFIIKEQKQKNELTAKVYSLIKKSKKGTFEEANYKDLLKNIPADIEEYLLDILSFTTELVDDKFDNTFKFLSEKDEIANELLLLQERLKLASEKDLKTYQEENLRSKLDEGSSKITEILQYVTDLNELAFNILKELANFLDIQQGGMFILNETEPGKPIFEMFASYAFDKKRYALKKIPINEGLIGRVYMERESIFMTEIPKNYTLIESGFGDQEPKCLLIVPLIFNNKVQAVIELAAKDSIEDYKIKFIENIGENIASTISNLKHTNQTEDLLEQTRIQSEEIENQRKTLEEKINTHRKQNRNLDKEILQLIEIIESIKSITYMIEFDLNGTIMDLSGKTLNLLGAKKEDLISLHHKNIIIDAEYEKTYESFWIDLLENKTKILEEIVTYNEKEYKLSQSYVPIRNAKRKIYRILSIGTFLNK